MTYTNVFTGSYLRSIRGQTRRSRHHRRYATLYHIYITNKFYVALGLLSDRSQMRSKCVSQIIDVLGCAVCHVLFIPHFDAFSVLLLNRRNAAWNLFVWNLLMHAGSLEISKEA